MKLRHKLKLIRLWDIYVDWWIDLMRNCYIDISYSRGIALIQIAKTCTLSTAVVLFGPYQWINKHRSAQSRNLRVPGISRATCRAYPKTFFMKKRLREVERTLRQKHGPPHNPNDQESILNTKIVYQ